MGEAKRKSAANKTWEARLTPHERIVASEARALHERFVIPLGLTGACYRLAFFLSVYLDHQHQIATTPIVGYSHDGTGDIMPSHAWLEHNGKKTDISLTLSEDRELIPTGPLLILDRAFTTGDRPYTYHLQPSSAAIAAEREALTHPQYGALVAHKRQEHTRMVSIATDRQFMRTYLDAAPDGLTYQRIADLLIKNRRPYP